MLRSLMLCAVAFISLSIIGCTAERAETGEIESAGSVDAFSLRVGDCFDDQAAGVTEVEDVPGVPCTEPHDNEIYAAFDLEMAEWPGEKVAGEVADAGCMERFEAAIGAPYEESVLVFWRLIPTAGSWEYRKDREVLCAAYHMDLEKLTQSVLGSGM